MGVIIIEPKKPIRLEAVTDAQLDTLKNSCSEEEVLDYIRLGKDGFIIRAEDSSENQIVALTRDEQKEFEELLSDSYSYIFHTQLNFNLMVHCNEKGDEMLSLTDGIVYLSEDSPQHIKDSYQHEPFDDEIHKVVRYGDTKHCMKERGIAFISLHLASYDEEVIGVRMPKSLADYYLKKIVAIRN